MESVNSYFVQGKGINIKLVDKPKFGCDSITHDFLFISYDYVIFPYQFYKYPVFIFCQLKIKYALTFTEFYEKLE